MPDVRSIARLKFFALGISIKAVTSYFLKTGHRASFPLEFVEKHVAAGSSGKFLVVLRNIFSRPLKVEVVKNELYHVKKTPFKCIKNNYFC